MRAFSVSALVLAAGCFGRIDPTAIGPAAPRPEVGGEDAADGEKPRFDAVSGSPLRESCRISNAVTLPHGNMCIAATPGGGVFYIPLDGGPVVAGPRIEVEWPLTQDSLGLQGSDLFLCDGTVARISLANGKKDVSDVACFGVTADRSGIWVNDFPGGSIVQYADFEHLKAHAGVASFPVRHASRIAIAGSDLISAWHSSHELQVGKPDEPGRSLPLENYDGWFTGVDRLEDGRYVIGTWFTDRELRIFTADGKFDRSVSLAPAGIDMVSGLVCGRGETLLTDSCPLADEPPPPPPAENCGAGGYEPSRYSDATTGAHELHVVGVYEGQYAGPTHGPCTSEGDSRSVDLPACPAERPRGVVEVVLKPTEQPVILVLSSYEPVDFQLKVEPGARLARVVTHGYYTHSVRDAPRGTLIETHSHEAGQPYIGSEYSADSAGFASFIAKIRAREKVREASFQGCYSGKTFHVPYAP